MYMDVKAENNRLKQKLHSLKILYEGVQDVLNQYKIDNKLLNSQNVVLKEKVTFTQTKLDKIETKTTERERKLVDEILRLQKQETQLRIQLEELQTENKQKLPEKGKQEPRSEPESPTSHLRLNQFQTAANDHQRPIHRININFEKPKPNYGNGNDAPAALDEDRYRKDPNVNHRESFTNEVPPTPNAETRNPISQNEYKDDTDGKSNDFIMKISEDSPIRAIEEHRHGKIVEQGQGLFEFLEENRKRSRNYLQASLSDSGASQNSTTVEDKHLSGFLQNPLGTPASTQISHRTSSQQSDSENILSPKTSKRPRHENIFKDQKVVLSGEFNLLGLNKHELKQQIISLGGVVTGSISSKTNMLLVGSILLDGRPVDMGNKYLEAESRGLPIYTERHVESFLNCPTIRNASYSKVLESKPVPECIKLNPQTNNDIERTKQTKNLDHKFPACVQVVRKKCERSQLPGHTCEHCSDFYNAIDTSHFSERQKSELVNQISRHRYHHADKPPDTPPHFWSLPSLSTPPH